MKKDDILQKITAVIFGHNVADALGVPVEFVDRKKLDKNPVNEMRGFVKKRILAGINNYQFIFCIISCKTSI